MNSFYAAKHLGRFFLILVFINMTLPLDFRINCWCLLHRRRGRRRCVLHCRGRGSMYLHLKVLECLRKQSLIAQGQATIEVFSVEFLGTHGKIQEVAAVSPVRV